MSLNLLEVLAAIILGMAIALAFFRFIRGPSALDRVVGADTLSVIITAGLVAVAAWFSNPVYLDVALVYGALAFVGVVAIARAIEGEHS